MRAWIMILWLEFGTVLGNMKHFLARKHFSIKSWFEKYNTVDSLHSYGDTAFKAHGQLTERNTDHLLPFLAVELIAIKPKKLLEHLA
jgi:hypothetical protein